MPEKVISRAALGRAATHGDLYNAANDTFSGTSVFRRAIPESAKSIQDSGQFSTNKIQPVSDSEKYSKMNIGIQQQVSVLAGLITPTGSGEYLLHKKDSQKAVEIFLVSSFTTKVETINVYHDDLKDCFSSAALENCDATHFVRQISWGAQSILSFYCENPDNRSVNEIHAFLTSQLKRQEPLISDIAENVPTPSSESGIKFTVKVYGDVFPINEPVPTDIKGAYTWIKNLPSHVKYFNNGLGKPLEYGLVPVSTVMKYLNVAATTKISFKDCDLSYYERTVQLFDKYARTQQKWNDFYHDAIKYRCCLVQRDVESIEKLKNELRNKESKLKSELAQTLFNVRMEIWNISKYDELLGKKDMDLAVSVDGTENGKIWDVIIEKLNFAKSVVDGGAKYIGTGTPPDEVITDSKNKSFVLYFTQKGMSYPRWGRTKYLFFSKLEKQKHGQIFYAVDCDIHRASMPKGFQCCIEVYQAGILLIKDLFTHHDKYYEPLAKATTGTERICTKPNKLTPLKILCCGESCDQQQIYEWKCKKCFHVLEYGFDEHLYCNCGRTPAFCFKFKCSDPEHGPGYVHYEENNLKMALSKLRLFEELNILILGETGVGKSTWINGFMNFLSYESLDDAINGDLLTLIPSKFTVYDDDCKMNPITVQTGEDPNETMTVGQSATQEPKVYPFTIGNTTIRLIDTPGVGDTRGAEQDQKNVEKVLGILSHYEEIHGICILLKPNNSRINFMFQFCIKELLKYLHRDASSNIIFCFTYSRSTFYRPGDTLPALSKLLADQKDVDITLSKQTIYCFDSEAYRFLAAVKNKPPVIFTESEKDNFAKSWEHSYSETQRLLHHIQNCAPHSIKNTLNLNRARDLVLKLSRPLAEICSVIENNKVEAEREMKEIESTNSTIQNLRSRQIVTRMELQVKELEHAKTVCTNNACVQVWGENGIEYKTVCHDRCTLLGVNSDTVGHFMLLGCKAMKWGKCTNCDHSYREHMYILYASVPVEREEEDKTVTQCLHQNLSEVEQKQLLLNAKNEEIREYEEELKQIRTSSVRFAYFLKKNAITPYNDCMEIYLRKLIEDEQRKVDQDRKNRAVLDKLLASKKAYDEEKELLETQMNQGSLCDKTVTDPAEIDRLVGDLYKLRLCGKALKETLECIKRTQDVVYQESQIQTVIGKENTKLLQHLKTKFRNSPFHKLVK